MVVLLAVARLRHGRLPEWYARPREPNNIQWQSFTYMGIARGYVQNTNSHAHAQPSNQIHINHAHCLLLLKEPNNKGEETMGGV